MANFRLDSSYSIHEIEYILTTLVNAGLIDRNELAIHTDFLKKLEINFFSVNDILTPFSKEYFQINNEQVSLFRHKGDAIGAYNYIANSIMTVPSVYNEGIVFTIKSCKSNSYEITAKHKKGTISTVFREYTEYISAITAAINLIFESNNTPLFCLPVMIVETDFILFTDKLHAFKIVSERILNISGISYPEIDQWIKSRSNEPFAF